MNTNNSNIPHTGGTGGMEERLWNYIDGNTSPKEKTGIIKLLDSNAAWKAKYKELLEIHQLIQSSELEAPSMRFSKNVMDEIARVHIAPATKTYINKRIIWSIGIFFIVLVVGFVIYSIGQTDWAAPNTTTDKYVGKIDFSRIFSNTWVNVFMMINVVLGLFLLDNYLSNKRKAFRKT